MATKNETQTKPEDVDAEGAEQAAAAPGRRLPFKLILIAAGGLVALVAAGDDAYHVGSHSASATASPGKPAVFLDMPDVLVNLSASGGEPTQYLKVKVTLELPDQAIQAQIQPVMAASATAWRCASPSRCANPA